MPHDFPNAREITEAIRVFLKAASAESPEAMAALVSATNAVALRNVDAWERMIRHELWVAESGQSSSAWKFWRRSARFASWLDLCNANGRMREAILRTASGAAPNWLFLAFAMRRLNDWVPEVRAAARENLPRIVRASEPQHVADALWTVLAHCNSWGRMEARDRTALEELISLEAPARALHARLLTATAGPAPTVLAQASRTSVLDAWLEEIANNAVQPAVRAMAYQFLFTHESSWVIGRDWKWIDLKWCIGRFEPVLDKRELNISCDVPVLLRRAVSDPSAMVRRVSADALIRHLASLGAEATVLAEKLSADRNESVAERGRYALQRTAESRHNLHS